MREDLNEAEHFLKGWKRNEGVIEMLKEIGTEDKVDLTEKAPEVISGAFPVSAPPFLLLPLPHEKLSLLPAGGIRRAVHCPCISPSRSVWVAEVIPVALAVVLPGGRVRRFLSATGPTR